MLLASQTLLASGGWRVYLSGGVEAWTWFYANPDLPGVILAKMACSPSAENGQGDNGFNLFLDTRIASISLHFRFLINDSFRLLFPWTCEPPLGRAALQVHAGNQFSADWDPARQAIAYSTYGLRGKLWSRVTAAANTKQGQVVIFSSTSRTETAAIFSWRRAIISKSSKIATLRTHVLDKRR
jgi:hypothetical protein